MLRSLYVILTLIEFIGFLAASMFIGLWWHPEFVVGLSSGLDGSLLRATGGLVIASFMYMKYVVAPIRLRSTFHFCFYTVLAVVAVTGYLYGVFFIWLA